MITITIIMIIIMIILMMSKIIIRRRSIEVISSYIYTYSIFMTIMILMRGLTITTIML